MDCGLLQTDFGRVLFQAEGELTEICFVLQLEDQRSSEIDDQRMAWNSGANRNMPLPRGSYHWTQTSEVERVEGGSLETTRGLAGQLSIHDGQDHLGEIYAQLNIDLYDVSHHLAENPYVEDGAAFQELRLGFSSLRGRCSSSSLRGGLSIDQRWRSWYSIYDDEV